jgi:hypothetical protein
MPGSILLASQGGTCPRTIISNPDTNTLKLEVEGGSEAVKEDHHHGAGQQQIEDKQADTPSWVKGGKEEDNQRYRDLLQYMEEKRTDARNMLAADEERI